VGDEPMTDGEIKRNFARLERGQKDGDDRHAKLAAEMVPTALWKAEHEALQDDVRELRDEVRETAKRIERTSLERMGVLTGKIEAVSKRQSAHEKSHADNTSWSRNKKLIVGVGMLGAAATIAAAWIAAALASGGLH
jgi:hypothetical protein